MKNKLTVSSLFFAVALLSASTGHALPPVRANSNPYDRVSGALAANLKAESDFVVTGIVTAVKSEFVPLPAGMQGWNSTTHRVVVRLESAEKGKLTPVKNGGVLTTTVEWRSYWTGRFSSVPGKGDRCRFFIKKGNQPGVWNPVYLSSRLGVEILEKAQTGENTPKSANTPVEFPRAMGNQLIDIKRLSNDLIYADFAKRWQR